MHWLERRCDVLPPTVVWMADQQSGFVGGVAATVAVRTHLEQRAQAEMEEWGRVAKEVVHRGLFLGLEVLVA